MAAKEFKVGPKLIMGFMLMAVIGAMIGFIGIGGTKAQEVALDIIYSEKLAAAEVLSDITFDLANMREALYSMLLLDEADKKAAADELSARMEAITKNTELINKRVNNSNGREQVAIARKSYADFAQQKDVAVEEILKLKPGLEVSPAAKAALADARSLNVEAANHTAALTEMFDEYAKNRWELSHYGYAHVVSLQLVLMALSAVIALALGVKFSRGINKLLKEAAKGS